MTPSLRLVSVLLLTLVASPAVAQPRQGDFGPTPHSRWPSPGEPVALLVHGINADLEDYVPLANDLEARGRRVIWFHYDDRRRLDASATALGEAVRNLVAERRPGSVAIVAHSMGGLISRRALTVGHPAGLAELGRPIDLVTMATSFGGFRAADFLHHPILGPPKWAHRWLKDCFWDLGSRTPFIAQPGDLPAHVRHTKIETDERRRVRLPDGSSAYEDPFADDDSDGWNEPTDDSKVALKSQRSAHVDAQARRRLTVREGHVGVFNDGGAVSAALAEVLDEALGPRRGIARALAAASD